MKLSESLDLLRPLRNKTKNHNPFRNDSSTFWQEVLENFKTHKEVY
jgi:hypothetical protein